MLKRKQLINRITKVGIFGALSVILYDFVKFPLPFFPSFLEINFSMLPIILIALVYGPVDAIVLVIIRFLLKLPFSHTAYVGELGDLIIGLLVVIPSGLIYRFNKTKKGGVISLIVAFFIWTIFGGLSNLVTIPIYLKMFFKNDINTLLAAVPMINNINESNYMLKYLFYAAIPFNALIAFVVCSITYLVYKKISVIFKHDFVKKEKKLKVMVMVDSFKGTLSSKEAGNIIKDELNKRNLDVDMIPIADGGEGFLDVIKEIKKLDYLKFDVNDAIGRIHSSRYLFDDKSSSLYVELAEACGIQYLKQDELAPYEASSYGLGEMILKGINKHHPKNIIVGIGGSASSDAGSGMLEALGVKFYDKSGCIITNLNNAKLKEVDDIDITCISDLFKNINVEVLTDVLNPLLGKNGAVYVFAPQKGAKISDLEVMEANIKAFVEIVKKKNLNNQILSNKSEGAAGGVGFSFNQIIKAEMVSGTDTILKLINFKDICNKYDVIITGEGRLDEQTLDGKIIKGIMEYNPKRLIIVVGGSSIKLDNIEVYAIVPDICSLNEAIAKPKESLQKLIRTIKLK